MEGKREEIAGENEGGAELEELPIPGIVKLHKKGLEKEEILDRFQGLSERELKAAVSYYYCNRREVENRIEESEG